MLKRDPQRKAEKEKQKLERQRDQEAAAFARTPQGQARAAKEQGDGLFQIVLSLGATTQRLPAVAGRKTRTVRSAHIHAATAATIARFRLFRTVPPNQAAPAVFVPASCTHRRGDVRRDGGSRDDPRPALDRGLPGTADGRARLEARDGRASSS